MLWGGSLGIMAITTQNLKTQYLLSYKSPIFALLRVCEGQTCSTLSSRSTVTAQSTSKKSV